MPRLLSTTRIFELALQFRYLILSGLIGGFKPEVCRNNMLMPVMQGLGHKNAVHRPGDGLSRVVRWVQRLSLKETPAPIDRFPGIGDWPRAHAYSSKLIGHCLARRQRQKPRAGQYAAPRHLQPIVQKGPLPVFMRSPDSLFERQRKEFPYRSTRKTSRFLSACNARDCNAKITSPLSVDSLNGVRW